jgi:hypothetical protein
MIYLGIDPGETHSGVVLYDSVTRQVLESWSGYENTWLAKDIAENPASEAVCERIAPMGQPMSKNLVATAEWSGVFWGRWPRRWHWITRNEVKVAICGRCQGVSDPHVLTGTQERFGGKAAARGCKAAPGPLYGVSGHAWQALACVIAHIERLG